MRAADRKHSAATGAGPSVPVAARIPTHSRADVRAPKLGPRGRALPRTMHAPTLSRPAPRSLAATALAVLPGLLILLASLSGCDAASTDPDGPPPLDPLPSDAQALVVSAFQDVESLFDLGVGADAARTASSSCCGLKLCFASL